ncbi:MAG TPA: hypothetical protein VHT72_04230, partial [Puia sp.]|nr:hypothetical protein [Puia sp.]
IVPVARVITQNDSLSFRFGAGNLTDVLRGFAVYKAEGNFNIDSAHLFRFIPNNSDPVTGFSLKALITDSSTRYFVTAISRTNNESEPLLIYPVPVKAP